ncbi:PREDICTED: F-box protein At1g31080 [Camelina sativa]|uniref:F-box protein At1g31080 n=1 Tax=Camelina sativa TaxID=90675 RepID=A0ABM0WZV1_CAMSA|nr:PREDICTED: F-box protein At1g31080 [Camelina sativa]
MKFFEGRNLNDFSYASGLIYFRDTRMSVICNPSTGQYAILPPGLTDISCLDLLGFDPIEKQYKVLVIYNRVGTELVFHILTLGTGKMRWRNIQCPSNHDPFLWCRGICINGVVYYLAQQTDELNAVIVCFDVRSEKFKFLLTQVELMRWPTKLINYKGKVGVIMLQDGCKGRFLLKLHIWVLEDVGKEELTAYAYTLSDENNVVKDDSSFIGVVGVTASGEIVLADPFYKPFYVYYFNLERNTLRSVEIQGIKEGEEWFSDHRVYSFVDHVEDLRFDVMKTTYAETSISQPEQSTSSTSSRGDHQVTTVAHEKQD